MELLKIVLTLISGAAWTYVYISAIRLGSAQHTYAIPFFALCLNFAWEVLYGVIGLQHATGFSSSLSIQAYIICVWAIFDILILRTFFLYAKYEPPWWRLRRSNFFALAAVGLLLAAAIQLTVHAAFGTRAGATYSAFLQNLVMSILFVRLYFARRTHPAQQEIAAHHSGPNRGQSLGLATAKFIGSFAATIIFGILEENWPIALAGAAVASIDIAYIGLLWRDRSKDPAHLPEDLEAA